jgi:hypothetical protein
VLHRRSSIIFPAFILISYFENKTKAFTLVVPVYFLPIVQPKVLVWTCGIKFRQNMYVEAGLTG